MTDPLTIEIRRAVSELADAAPLPPDLPDRRPQPSGHRKRPLVVVGVMTLAAMLATSIVLVERSRSTTKSVATSGSGATPPTPSAASQPDLNDAPAPTFVLPTSVPAKLKFIAAASTNFSATAGSGVLQLVGPELQSAHLTWIPSTACTKPLPVTTVARGSNGSVATQEGIIPTSPQSAVYRDDDGSGIIEWCDRSIDVLLTTSAMGEAASRALADTIRSKGNGAFTLVPPPMFRVGRPDVAGLGYAVRYGVDASVSSRPEMTVSIRVAWTDDIGLIQSSSGFTSAPVVSVGGHQGFEVDIPGAPGQRSVTVLFDKQTIVSVDGNGLSADQLLSTAASLVSADPTLAPDIGADVTKCNLLGLCG